MRVKIQVNDGKILISVPKQYRANADIAEAIGDAEEEIEKRIAEGHPF